MTFAAPTDRLSVGYVLKTYPRLSETFVLNEILEMERRGVHVTIFASKRPAESRFHEKLARVNGDVLYAPEVRSSAVVDFLASRLSEIEGLEPVISDLFWDALRNRSGEELQALVPAISFVGPVRERGIVHLHAHFATAATSIAMHLAWLSGIGYSFTAHAKDIFHESVDPSRLSEKIRRADFVVAVSEWSARYLGEVARADVHRKVHRIYNGLDMEEFPPPASPTRRDPPLIVSIGRLVPKKGFSTLVDAGAILRAAGLRFRIEIAGDGELKDELTGRIRTLALDDVVTLRGALSHDAVRELLTRASVFALPAQIAEDGNRDGLPVVLVEAMASGIPVISTPVVGIPEAVEDGVTGLLVPERDPEALARAIRALLGDPDRAALLAGAALARVRDRFDLRKSVASLHALVLEAVNARRSPREAGPVAKAAR